MAFAGLNRGVVAFYLPCDGSSIADTQGNTVTLEGSVALTTDQCAPLTGNTKSAHLDGLSSPKAGIVIAPADGMTDIGLGNYLFAAWVRPSSVGAAWQTLLQIGHNFALEIDIKDEGVIASSPDGTAIDSRYVGLAADTQQLIEVSRTGGVTRFFLDGALIETSTLEYSISATTGGVRIGSSRGASGSAGTGLDGYVDDVIFARGGGNTAAYTPPTGPFSVLLDAAGSSSTGSAAVPIEIHVVGLGSASVPLDISVAGIGSAAVGLEVGVVDAALLSGSASLTDGGMAAAVWSPVVEIDGEEVTDDVIGEISVEATEGGARVAEFSVLASGTIDLPAWVGKRVVIDIADASRTNRLRLFTGLIDLPTLDLDTATIALDCTDDLQHAVNALPREALDALIGGRWSAATFDASAGGWVYAQDRLSTVPASLDASPFGALRLTPWEAKAVADIDLDADSVLEGSVTPSFADRGALLNQIDIAFGYRFARAKREAFSVVFSYIPASFAEWVDAGNHFLYRSAVEGAIEAAGGALNAITYMPLPTEGVPVGGGFWIPNPYLDPQLCLGFEAVVTFDYTQDVEEQHQIIVASSASIAAVGQIRSTMSDAIEARTDDTVATETSTLLYQRALTTIPPVIQAPVLPGYTTAETIPATADTDRASAEAAMATLIDVAKTRIAASHRRGLLSASVALDPRLDVDKTVSIDAQGVTAKGKVTRVRHRMAVDAGTAISEFDLAICRLDGLGLAAPETATAAPAGVADGTTSALGAPVCSFNGQLAQDGAFSITFPGVDASERNALVVELPSYFEVPIVEDDQTIVL